jgi:hypothetical protein
VLPLKSQKEVKIEKALIYFGLYRLSRSDSKSSYELENQFLRRSYQLALCEGTDFFARLIEHGN